MTNTHDEDLTSACSPDPGQVASESARYGRHHGGECRPWRFPLLPRFRHVSVQYVDDIELRGWSDISIHLMALISIDEMIMLVVDIDGLASLLGHRD
jgi:hypothetical protein